MGNCNIIPSCFDCVLQPHGGIDSETFFCKGKGSRHWVLQGVCPLFIPDYESYEELVKRYPDLSND